MQKNSCVKTKNMYNKKRRNNKSAVRINEDLKCY